jgi:pimeloyl-ACP methyl ester carboxylesterase
MSNAESFSGIRNVVLVHGGFVDGSGWEGVYRALTKSGHSVTIVQNPTISLADDVAVTRRAIAAQDGPVILVGHSYGGAVVTEAGTDPKVAAVVYIAAFAPDAGESVASLIKDPVPGAPVPPILPPQDGFLFLDRSKFHASFAADVEASAAQFMADSQVPWGLDALGGAITQPAWRSKPSWYLVATNDRMIPPDAQRAMSKRAGSTVVEVEGSHAVYVSQPQAVASDCRPPAKGARRSASVVATGSALLRRCGHSTRVAVGAIGGEGWRHHVWRGRLAIAERGGPSSVIDNRQPARNSQGLQRGSTGSGPFS